MKIIEKPNPSIEFSEANPGDVLKYSGRYYIKTEEVYSAGTHLNAVDLCSGKHTFFCCDIITEFVGQRFIVDGGLKHENQT